MRKRIGIVLGIALALPLTADLAASARAERPRKHRPVVKELLAAETFADAGEFSGPIAGTMYLNGMLYRVSPEVLIYDVGRGALPAGTVVYGRRLSCSGFIRKGTMIVDQVIVRSGVVATGLDRDKDKIREVPQGMSGPE